MAGIDVGQAPHSSTPNSDPSSWLDTEFLAMQPGIEIIEGINRELVAFDPLTGRYTRLSRSGAAIVRALDGTMTGRQFAAQAVAKESHGPSTEKIVLAFLEELRAAGLLTIAPASDRQHAAVRFARLSHMPRRALIRGKSLTVLDSLARLIRSARWPLGLLWGSAALFSLWATWSVISTPRAVEQISVWGLTWGWVVLVGIALTQTAIHELSHAVACRYYGIPVREIGVGLLFYFIPAAYVDRTDAYRLPSRRARVLIALAGVCVDILWLGGYAILAEHVGGQLQQVCILLLWLQVAALVGNLNPLLPTDGYDALEAGLGAVNLRARAFTSLRCLVLRQPLPSWLATRSRPQRARYLLFGLVCLSYAALVVGFILRSLVVVIG